MRVRISRTSARWKVARLIQRDWMGFRVGPVIIAVFRQ